MLSIPGKPGCTCDGWSRREFMRVGGAGLFGVALGDILRLQALGSEPASDAAKTKAGWGRAKSVILIFLQGGPSHIDIWDPKPEAPSNVRGEFKTLRSKVPGIWLSEVMPKLAEQMDKATLIRSVSYTPAGLFNHTAAIYQMMTGYTPDRVSPSGQLEPPSPNDFPHAGSQIIRLKPLDGPMLPFVMLPRPLQESNVIGKGGTAGFLGPAYDPYYFYQDPAGEVKLDDLSLREGISKERMERRATLLKKVEEAMPEMEKAVSSYALDKYYQKAFDLVLSGRARNAFDLTQEPDKVRDKYGRHTFGQGCLMARRLIEAGTRFVQMNWPSVANGDPNTTAWDTHAANFGPLRNLHCPKLDSGLSSLLEELDVPATIHEGTTQNLPQAGMERYENFLFRHVISHPHEQQMAVLSFICGVLQLHQFLFNAFLLAALGLPFGIRGGCNEQYCNDKYSLHKSFQSRVSMSCRIALPIKCELFPSQPQTTGNQFAPRIPCSRGRLLKSM